ncbi:MAG: ribosome small subunit-dependent GTPase A [Treponema sp.]|jgi:ribosome biogenesis GTPase|nr:ribosome small subunit-dependent GTPase A [Treponema sp.]
MSSEENIKRGTVISGSWNIFTVRLESECPGEGPEVIECRIKGKVLKGVDSFYNPLAPGDRVTVEQGQIVSLEERKNCFTRFNQKGFNAKKSAAEGGYGTAEAAGSQIIAANADLVLCVSSPALPPFRPRFLDRVLAQADHAGIPAAVICNKWDLHGGDIDIEERLEDFVRIGFPVLRMSAQTGKGIEELKRLVSGRFSVLVGQSGVGKSSIINALRPALPETQRIRTGAINEKYDRGNHTTTQSLLVEIPGGGAMVDTPGIRRFVPDGISPADLIMSFREFAPLAGTCSFGLSCSHVSEPGCKILEAVNAGAIHEDRYESYLRIREELAGMTGF